MMYLIDLIIRSVKVAVLYTPMLTNTYLCLHHAEVGLSSVYLWVCLINVGDTE